MIEFIVGVVTGTSTVILWDAYKTAREEISHRLYWAHKRKHGKK
jgi:hypothetical protein